MNMIRPTIVLFLVLSLLTGIIYPLLVTGIGQLFFKKQANGSLITQDGKIIGSELIGQYFTSPRYFWGRPSATALYPYNAIASRGSNLGPLNPELIQNIKIRKEQWGEKVPIDLITSSASGLDPHISPASAFYQAKRIAQVRGITLDKVHHLININIHIEQQLYGLFGEPRVNVLKLNLALDSLHS